MNRQDVEKAITGIPLGTVKWHLFEAKKELKRGMVTMRKAGELKFNPIKFHSYGINGSVGTKSPDEFLRSTLSQNICYSVRNRAKTVNEIADDLGVSPVYVETEAEFLEEYGFLKSQKDKYFVNFIISEPSAELLAMQNNMYRRASELFANDLYDELISSGILDDPDIRCGQTDGPIFLTDFPKADRNFILWSLIPYIAPCIVYGAFVPKEKPGSMKEKVRLNAAQNTLPKKHTKKIPKILKISTKNRCKKTLFVVCFPYTENCSERTRQP